MESVHAFIDLPALAIVGTSRSGKKFGNVALRELRAKGYRVYPVHPGAASTDGVRCYASLTDVPEPVDGLLVVVPPTQAADVLRQAAAGECVLMFSDPTAFHHRAHRWVWSVLGRLPN